MKKYLLFSLIVLLFNNLNAQFNFEYSNEISVKIGTDTLKLPWAGGLNYVQISDFDFDFDGDLDLFVFDRSSDNIRVFTKEFINSEDRYILQHNTDDLFPPDIRYRATMVDYNNDGKKDLFCYGVGGIKVYKNTGSAGTGLQWTVAKDLLYSDNWGMNLNLYVSSADIPAIVDVDFDGDIDVLTYHIGGEHMQYHQNQSMELYGVPDSLEFKLMNECWGGFREDLNTSSLYLNDPNSPCVTGNIPGAELPENPNDVEKKPTAAEPKHSGSTVLALDYDNSGVMDLVLGDVSFNNLNLLINGGTAPNTNSMMISVDNTFPSNSQPVDMTMFPAAFFVDTDFDGKKDLIVSANAKNVSENETSVWFYKNMGSNSNPTFVYQTNAFLQNEMIEHGTGSVPVFVDLNQDGLEDMLVSNFFRFKAPLSKEGSIAYYKNTGTSSNPFYTLVDDDLLNLSSAGLGLRMLPTFGDLDGDGDKEMLLGLENGSIAYYENISIAGGITFAPPITNYQDNLGSIISAGQYASPQLFDLNKDGKLDLILGKKTGELAYYENTGTSAAPSFTLMNDTLGNIDIATTSPDGFPVPHFFDYNDTTYLFLGGVDGKLHYYNMIDDHLLSGDTFNLVSDNFLGINVGAYSSFWVNNVDNDVYLDLFVGQDLGGISHLETDPNSQAYLNELKSELQIDLFPNPTTGILNIKGFSAENIHFSIIDLTGKELIGKRNFLGTTQLDLNEFSAGIYLILFESENGSSCTKRIVKQ